MNCTPADRSVSLGRGTTLPHPGSRSHLWRRHHAQNSRYGIRDKPIAPASPWQNGFAERLIGSIRRECVDHIVVWGEGHLRGNVAIMPELIFETDGATVKPNQPISAEPQTPKPAHPVNRTKPLPCCLPKSTEDDQPAPPPR